MTAPVCSRRVSAGIRPDPGATARLRPWWSAADWLAEDVTAALDAHPELLRACHVSRDTVRKVAEGMAGFADYRTGRQCRPTNERLVEVARCSLSTVQRARRVLERLGVVRRLVQGRSYMTRAERLTAWGRGSSHRQIAAEFALCGWPRRAPKRRPTKMRNPPNIHRARPANVERDTPPGPVEVGRVSHLRRSPLRRRTENEERRSAPRTYQGGPPGKVGGVHPGTERLAQAVRSRLGWLGGVSWRRLAPTLSRFARAGWTARDVELAVSDALAARGWRRPAQLQQPAAYLALLLRELDPADRPGAAEEFMYRMERAEDAYRLQLATGAPCPHGMPAGDVPSPLRGIRACPQCRGTAP